MAAHPAAPSYGVATLPGAAPEITISAERLRCAMLWLTGACGAIVFVEPSPYEVMSFLTLATFAFGGLTLSSGLMPLGVLLVLVNTGYSISGWTVIDDARVLPWLITSWYLALTALFFAAMLGVNTEARLNAVLRGCVIGGVIASIAAIVGYSRVFSGLNDLLLLYDRSRGTFMDPNVLGAFLIFPTLLAMQPVFSGTFRQAIKSSLLVGLMATAILLSFSRAAWGQIVYTAAIMLALTFITTRSPSHRLRIVLLSMTGVVLMALFIAALISIDSVADLFKQRASFEQSYDLGAQGRFARYGLGAILALDKPFGIGPLQFAKFFPEDTHDSFLNAFMSGGWLSGACYPVLIALTLIYGFRAVFVRTPWQPSTIAVFAGLFGVVSESVIIDIDHWRHTFLLLGVMWGLIAATKRHERLALTSSVDNRHLPDRNGPALAHPEAASYRFARRSVAQPG